MEDYINLHLSEFFSRMDVAADYEGMDEIEKERMLYWAFYELGHALHPVMDSTSPPHEGFQPWEGMEHFIDAGNHWRREQSITPERMRETINRMHQYYKGSQQK